MWGSDQGLPAAQEPLAQESLLFRLQEGLEARGSLEGLASDRCLTQQPSWALSWGSEQQTFLHQQPGTPTEMLTHPVSNENRRSRWAASLPVVVGTDVLAAGLSHAGLQA